MLPELKSSANEHSSEDSESSTFAEEDNHILHNSDVSAQNTTTTISLSHLISLLNDSVKLGNMTLEEEALIELDDDESTASSLEVQMMTSYNLEDLTSNHELESHQIIDPFMAQQAL